MKDIKSLRIFEISMELGEIVWKIVEKWESFEKWTIGKQFVDSTDSISANLVEGYYRNQKGDLRKFFRYALSSAKESELWMNKAFDRNLINEDERNILTDLFDELLPKLVNFIKKIDI